MIRTTHREPWDIPMCLDDSSPERARFSALCAGGAADHAPGTHDGPATVAPSTQGAATDLPVDPKGAHLSGRSAAMRPGVRRLSGVGLRGPDLHTNESNRRGDRRPSPTQGCRVCGDLEIAVHNDNGRFCGAHAAEGMRWLA